MSGSHDPYADDIDQVVTGLIARGRHDEAARWRAGSSEYLAGRTGCHNWHSAKLLLAEFDKERSP
jgi:hypothetical protein